MNSTPLVCRRLDAFPYNPAIHTDTGILDSKAKADEPHAQTGRPQAVRAARFFYRVCRGPSYSYKKQVHYCLSWGCNPWPRGTCWGREML